MKIKEAAKVLAGSCVVYALVVACGSVNPMAVMSVDDGGTALDAMGNPTGDALAVSDSTTGGDSVVGQILDALTDPVSEAKAQTQSTSGTRLKANWLVGSDGSKQFQNWHDSQLNVDCNFSTAGDGTTRCVPSNSYTTAYAASFWADSACSQRPGYMAYSACAGAASAPTYAYGFDSCSALHVYQVQGPYSAQSTTLSDGGLITNVYEGSGGPTGCYPVTPPSSYKFYSVGAELPPSTFVQATVQTDP